MKKYMSSILAVVCVVFLIIGLWFSYKGYYVIHYYENSDYASLNVNAYVGGDAYNYIINGTYFAGYMVIAMGSYVIAVISAIGSAIIPKESMEIPATSNRKLPEL